MRTIIFGLFSLLCQFPQLHCQNFTVIFPKHNEILSDRTPVLNWNSVDGVANYQVSLSLDSTFNLGVQQFSSSTTTLQFTNDLASGFWFWKVSATLNGQNIASNLGKFQIFEPTDISGLVVWLSSDTLVSLDQNNRVSSWNNLVGSNHFVNNNNQSGRPFVSSPISSMNNKKAIDFQGLEFLASTNNFTFNNASVFLLASQQSGDGNYGRFIDHDFSSGFWIGRDGLNNAIGGGFTESSPPYGNFVNLSNNLFSIITIIRLGSVVSSYQNSQSFPIPSRTSSSNTTVSNKISLGASISQSFFGKKRLMNILIYSTNLSVTQRKLVEKYQMDKYAPPVNLGADVSPIYQNNGTCINETITASSLYTNYLWSTGATTQSINVTLPGSYWVQTTDIFGRTSVDTIVIDNPKMNVFNFNEKLVCQSGFSTVVANTPSNHTFLQWSDGITNNSHNFSLSNLNQFFNFTFVNTNGCFVQSNLFSIALDTSLNSISLGPDTSICSNSLIELTSSPQVPISYLWNTNGTASNQLIQTAGEYWLQVTNAGGCINSDTIVVAISGEGPLLSVNIPSSTCIGSLVELSAQGVISAPESITSYSWDFGNTNTSFGDSASTIYNSSGTKQVQLTVTASNGCEVSLNQTIQVFPNPNVNITSLGSCLFDTVSFVTQNNGFNIQNYYWELGQNVTSSSALPNLVYNASGSYPISVIATDQNGCVDTSYTQLALTEILSNYSNVISIIWPKNNELLSDRTPLLSWNEVVGISNYQVSLSLDSTFNSGVQQFSTSLPSFQLTNNLNSGKWFWKVGTTLNGQNILSNIGKFQVFEPTDISGLVVWLSSDTLVNLDQSNRVSSWNNLVGTNHFVNNNQSSRPFVSPQISSMNNKKAIDFQGLEFLASTNSFTFNNTSLFLLASQQSGDGNYGRFIDHDFSSGFWIGRDGVNNSIGGGFTESSAPFGNFVNLSNNLYSLVSMIRLGSVVSSFQNSQPFPIPTRTSFSNTTASNKISLGASINQTLFGKKRIMNILIYSTNLSETQRKTVEKYQMDKYAPPVNLGADVSPIYQNNGTCVNETITASSLYTNFLWNTGATSQSIQATQPGSYWVQTTDIFGRTSRDTIVVNNPKMNMFSDVEFECFNGPSFLTANIPQNHSFIRWNNCNPNPTNQVHSGNNYFVEFENSQGCIIKSNLFSVAIDSSLAALSLGADTYLCSGNSIQLQNPPAGITTYTWNTSNTQSIQPVDTTGQYILDVTNINNCQNRDTIEVTVVGTSPTLQFSFSDTLCQFSPGSYFDSSFVPNNNGTISAKTWSISDGTILTGSTGNFIIDTSGVFNVNLLVQTQEGCSSSTSFPIVIHPKPILSFTTENYCPYDAVEFTSFNSQLSSLISQLWSFDDNTTSTSPNPTHIFGSTGSYNVSLQAQDINGCRDTVIQAVYIQPSPVADFTFSNSCEETEVSFVNNSVIADTFNLTTNTWIYGDGTQAINPSFEKIYADADTFDVELIVTANNGCQDTTFQSIIIYPRPTLDWQIGPACKNTWTTIESLSSVPVGNIVQTNWLVNLQYPLEGTNSAYQFVTTGVQYLNLTSTTDNGCQRDTLIIVNVLPEINASYTVTPSNVVAGISPVFSSTSIGADQYEWIFGFGNTELTVSDDPVVAPPYPTSSIGDTVITLLIIENQVGCKDSAYRYLKINEPRIDLAVNQLFAEELNGYFKIGVELKNQGVIEITQTDLILKILNSTPVLETETTPLAPGESRIYLFNANPSSFISTQDNESSFLCVESKSYNDFALIETELNNNYTCLNLEGGSLLLMPIFPNPTSGDITYSFLSANESEIKCSLTDETGRTILETSESTNAGLHSQTLPMRNLSAGVYYFHITDGTSAKTVKILKN